MKWLNLLRRAVAAAACWLLAASALCASEPAWLTGPRLELALSQQSGATWSNVPVRPALARFCQTHAISHLLDRRIDPDRKVDLSFDGVPLREGLERIASRLGGGLALVGPVAYFGPKPSAERIRTLAALRRQEAAALAGSQRAVWLRPRAFRWPDAAEPRALLTEIAAQNQLTIDELDRVPHDVWAGASLAPLNLSELLTLVLAQFDLTFELQGDGRTIRLVDAPADPTIEQRYPVKGSPSDLVGQLRAIEMLADAEISTSRNQLVIRGRAEDHDVVRDLLAGKSAKRTTVRESKVVHTLKVQLAADKLLAALAKKLELEIQYDRDAIAASGIALDQEVQLDVKDVSTDELFRAILDPIGLGFTRDGQTIKVAPKE